ncbi:MAG TPA: chorismate-binding protein, partial [Ktedonobacteraceae bacterium]
METVFPEVPVVDRTNWTIDSEKDLLLTTLRRATECAADTGRPALASILLPVPFCDALSVFHLFQQAQLGPGFFWEQSAQQKALVGVGAAYEIEVTGSERFAQATSMWRDLQHNTIVAYAGGTTPEQIGGPIFFGGFAFDPQLSHTELWRGFPDGLLVLPRLLFCAHKQQPTLTMNVLVEATSDLEVSVNHVISMLKLWQSTLKRQSKQAYPVPDVTHQLEVHDIMPRSEWEALVMNAVEEIERGLYTKVVLARDVEVSSKEQPFDVLETLARLRAGYPAAYVFAMQRGERYFIGATPERLIYGQDGQLRTMALAGSA